MARPSEIGERKPGAGGFIWEESTDAAGSGRDRDDRAPFKGAGAGRRRRSTSITAVRMRCRACELHARALRDRDRRAQRHGQDDPGATRPTGAGRLAKGQRRRASSDGEEIPRPGAEPDHPARYRLRAPGAPRLAVPVSAPRTRRRGRWWARKKREIERKYLHRWVSSRLRPKRRATKCSACAASGGERSRCSRSAAPRRHTRAAPVGDGRAHRKAWRR